MRRPQPCRWSSMSFTGREAVGRVQRTGGHVPLRLLGTACAACTDGNVPLTPTVPPTTTVPDASSASMAVTTPRSPCISHALRYTARRPITHTQRGEVGERVRNKRERTRCKTREFRRSERLKLMREHARNAYPQRA